MEQQSNSYDCPEQVWRTGPVMCPSGLERCLRPARAGGGQGTAQPEGRGVSCAELLKQKRRGRPVAICAWWEFQNQKRDEVFFVAPVIRWGGAALSRRAARGPWPDQAREYRHRLGLRGITAQTRGLACFSRKCIVPGFPQHRRIH